jgi:hypothetical protein
MAIALMIQNFMPVYLIFHLTFHASHKPFGYGDPTFRINTPIHNIFCSPVRVALEPSPESRSALSAG